ncbi:MAG: cell division protein FtsZ [Oscillospiraceae bacterium]|nr:cell division protein FtsZ [Oscillospiraceae bacterium]
MSAEYEDKVVAIKVIGIGGAGNNVVNRMISSGIQGVEFIAVNTDKQDLNKTLCENKLQIGEKLTGGMGAGSKPEIGKKSAEESRAAIAKILEGTDMVFITAGMGGGTGTGAAPIIADLAHESGILTVGVVTKPFRFEGANRMKQAEDGIAALQEKVDSLIIIPNDRLKYVTDQKITFANAFGIADDVLKQAVTSISELVGYSERVIINLDFADVSSIMKDAGHAHMGVGTASGRDKAEQAAMAAVASPLLETSINGATGVLINVTGAMDLGLDDVETAANIVMEAANPEANIIFGAAFNDEFEDEMRVTVIATGFDSNAKPENPVRPGAFSAASAANERTAVSAPKVAPVEDVNDIDEIFKIFNK